MKNRKTSKEISDEKGMKRYPNSVRWGTTFPKEFYDLLDDLAKKEFVSINSIIIRCVLDYIRNNKTDNNCDKPGP